MHRLRQNKAVDKEGLRKALQKFEQCHKLYSALQEHCKDTKLLEKMQNYLQGTKERDEHLYVEVSYFGVLAAYLYFINKQFEKAQTENDENEKRFSKNQNVLFLKTHLLINKGEVGSANKVIEKMQSIQNDVSEMFEAQCVPKADYAYVVAQFGPPYYFEAIMCFEEAITQMEGLDDSKDVGTEKLIIKMIWSYNIVQTYNRLINFGNIESQNKSMKLKPLECFEKICSFLPNVVAPGCVVKHLIYEGRAYIELYDAYKKLRNRHEPEVRRILSANLKDITDLKPEMWIQKAIDSAPHDGHILERLGRHYRSVASGMKGFKEAEHFLQLCVKEYPGRHVAWHQLSLCYRSMWIEQNGFKEAELHRNSVRNGFKNKKYGNKKKKKNQYNDAYTDMASNFGNFPKQKSKSGRKRHQRNRQFDANMNFSQTDAIQENGIERAMTNMAIEAADNGNGHAMTNMVNEAADNGNGQANTHTVDEDAAAVHDVPNQGVVVLDDDFSDEGIDPGDQEEVKFVQINVPENLQPPMEIGVSVNGGQVLTLPKFRQRTLYPNKPVDHGQLPKHYSRPDYYDQLRTSNPVGLEGSSSTYLDLAIECLKKANEIVHDTSCRYLTDLARLYVSKEDETAAMRYFELAENCNNQSLHDRAYLSEQFALYKDTLFIKQCTLKTDEIDDYDILMAYREAVLCAVRSREKSRMAFYQLEDMLKIKKEEEKMKGDSGNDVYEQEYCLLHAWVEKLAHAKGFLHEVLKTNTDVLYLQWELVYAFYRAGDMQSAFQYMMPLLDVDKMQNYTKDWKEKEFYLATAQKRDQAIDINTCMEIAFEAAEEYIRQHKLKECRDIYKEMFECLVDIVYFRHVSSVGDTNNLSSHSKVAKHHILLLSDEDARDLIEFVEFLKEYCSLQIYSHDDILHGMPTIAEMGKNSENASVILIDDKIYCDDNGNSELWLVKNEILSCGKIYQPKVSIAVVKEAERGTVIPRLAVGQYKVAKTAEERHHIVELLYRTIFVEYPSSVLTQK